jgi:hypothetical protein
VRMAAAWLSLVHSRGGLGSPVGPPPGGGGWCSPRSGGALLGSGGCTVRRRGFVRVGGLRPGNGVGDHDWKTGARRRAEGGGFGWRLVRAAVWLARASRRWPSRGSTAAACWWRGVRAGGPAAGRRPDWRLVLASSVRAAGA